MIYLDNNATTQLAPEALEEMLPFLQNSFGNASSRHHAKGWEAESAVKKARSLVAKLINADPQQVIFNSGATEGINNVLKGVALFHGFAETHIVTVKTEHSATLDAVDYLEKKGVKIDCLPVLKNGLIDVEILRKSIKPNTRLISVMYANNETGIIQPIEEIGLMAAEAKIPFFCDATQAVGKIKIDIEKLPVDIMVWSGHKIHGPKGIGALYVKRKSPRIKFEPIIHGGGQERGFRAGTLNVPSIVGFGKASELYLKNEETNRKYISELRDSFINEISNIERVKINNDITKSIYNTLSITIDGVESEALLMAIGDKLCISNGSACTSSSLNPSHVLKAMGFSDEDAFCTLRISLSRYNTKTEVHEACKILSESIKNLRGLLV